MSNTQSTLVSQLKDDTMSLEDKLKAIDAAMAAAQAIASDATAKDGSISAAAPFDPADLTMCESCQ